MTSCGLEFSGPDTADPRGVAAMPAKRFPWDTTVNSDASWPCVRTGGAPPRPSLSHGVQNARSAHSPHHTSIHPLDPSPQYACPPITPALPDSANYRQFGLYFLKSNQIGIFHACHQGRGSATESKGDGGPIKSLAQFLCISASSFSVLRSRPHVEVQTPSIGGGWPKEGAVIR